MKIILCIILFLLFWAIVHGGKKYAYEQEDERGTAGNCAQDWYDNE